MFLSFFINKIFSPSNYCILTSARFGYCIFGSLFIVVLSCLRLKFRTRDLSYVILKYLNIYRLKMVFVCLRKLTILVYHLIYCRGVPLNRCSSILFNSCFRAPTPD